MSIEPPPSFTTLDSTAIANGKHTMAAMLASARFWLFPLCMIRKCKAALAPLVAAAFMYLGSGGASSGYMFPSLLATEAPKPPAGSIYPPAFFEGVVAEVALVAPNEEEGEASQHEEEDEEEALVGQDEE
jgi:hypothetical protein